MNYKHVYHAGSFADVIKHASLSLILDYFCKKDKPFVYIDTHAGEGKYDLSRVEAKKTNESKEGILRLMNVESIIGFDLIKTYLQIIQELQIEKEGDSEKNISVYPGSPFIANYFLREMDRMILNEWHPSAFGILNGFFGRNKKINLHQRDAYEFLPAILPPDLKRVLVLIDPPFEKKSELRDIQEVFKKSFSKFPRATYVIWFALTDSFPNLLQNKKYLKSFSPPYCAFEFMIDNPPYDGLVGMAMMVVNPPYILKNQLDKLLPSLWEVFSPDKKGYFRTLFVESLK